MATTTNYSWTTPDDTDLVKDGAAAIRTLGSAIDTTVFTNAGAAIQKSIVDAAGDLIYATANDTPDRLALGTAGQFLAVNSGATAPEWVTPPAGGGLSLLSTTSVSGTSTTVSGISGSFQQLLIRITDFFPSVAGPVRFSFNANSGVLHSYHYDYSSTSDQNSTSGGADVHIFGGGVNIEATNNNNVVNILIDNYASATVYKPFHFYGGAEDAGGSFRPVFGGGWYRSASAVTSFILHSTQTLSGTITIYGVN